MGSEQMTQQRHWCCLTPIIPGGQLSYHLLLSGNSKINCSIMFPRVVAMVAPSGQTEKMEITEIGVVTAGGADSCCSPHSCSALHSLLLPSDFWMSGVASLLQCFTSIKRTSRRLFPWQTLRGGAATTLTRVSHDSNTQERTWAAALRNRAL